MDVVVVLLMWLYMLLGFITFFVVLFITKGLSNIKNESLLMQSYIVANIIILWPWLVYEVFIKKGGENNG